MELLAATWVGGKIILYAARSEVGLSIVIPLTPASSSNIVSLPVFTPAGTGLPVVLL